jgi:hypothetical protein
MGWLWNVQIDGSTQFKRGWKPGAVKNSVAKIMKRYLTPPSEPSPVVKPKNPPMLSVKKKNGEYLIVINPMDNGELLANSPIVFKIEKNQGGIKRDEARRILKDRGVIIDCDCLSISDCCCVDDYEKSRIKNEIEKVSQELCLNSKLTVLDLKDSSDSEFDTEYTPPSATYSKSPRKKTSRKQKFAYAQTQYEPQPYDSSEVDECKSQIDQKKEGKSTKQKEVQIKNMKGGESSKEVQRKILKNKDSSMILQEEALKGKEPFNKLRGKTGKMEKAIRK